MQDIAHEYGLLHENQKIRSAFVDTPLFVFGVWPLSFLSAKKHLMGFWHSKKVHVEQ